MGLRQKGRSFLSLESSCIVVEVLEVSPFVPGKTDKAAFFLFFFLFGEFFRLDLKLLFRGTLTIQVGGTISYNRII